MKKIIIQSLMCLLAGNATCQVFIDEITTTGLPANNGGVYEIIDYNNDYFDDLIYSYDSTNTGATPTFHLFKNNGDGTYTKNNLFNCGKYLNVYGDASSLGWSLIADFDNNGFQDFAIQEEDTLRFMFNMVGNGFFEDFTICMNDSLNSISRQDYIRQERSLPSTVSDYDGDGDLDILFVGFNGLGTKSVFALENKLNDDGTFSSRSELYSDFNPNSTAIMVMDYDNDQDDDIFIILKTGSSFASYPIMVLQNDNGVFSNVTSTTGIGSCNVFGFATKSDVNNDGYIDIIVGSTDAGQQNRLILNNGDGTFTNITNSFGNTGSYYYAGAQQIDFDNDGDFDISWDGSGFGYPGNPFYVNNNGSFTQSAASYGLYFYSGSTTQNFGTIPIWFDYDNDGLLDHFRSGGNVNPPRLLRNTLDNSNKFIRIHLMGCESNRDGVGSRVKVVAGNISTYQSNSGGRIQKHWRGNSRYFHFGIGDNNLVDSIIVYWPSGNISTLTNVNVNQFVTIEETAGCSNAINLNFDLDAGEDIFACAGDEITLSAVGADSYSWSGGITDGTPFIPTVGAETYTVIGTNGNGCVRSDSLSITVYELPELIVSSESAECLASNTGVASVIISEGQSPYFVSWSNGSSDTSIDSLLFGWYSVTITDNNGCLVIDSVFVNEVNEPCFFIPTGISPNDDGKNDIWLIYGLSDYPDSKVMVYNRWGQLLYDAGPDDQPWDGTYLGEELPTADYYYIIDLGNGDTFNGVITLKR
jgi:gliding motility-associated-like protein